MSAPGRRGAARLGTARLGTARLGTARLGPIQYRNFRLLAAGQLTSTVGDFCYAVALPWLVLSNHGGALLLGAILACYGIPRTLTIPLGGILADKLGPRALMLGADAVRCVLVAALAVLATQRLAALALLGPLAALIGAGEGLFLPASYAIMPTLVPADQLQGANAISSAMTQIGSLAGPALGGLLVGLAGPAPAFAVDAASFAVSALSLALISAQAQPAAGQDSHVLQPAGGPAGPGTGEPAAEPAARPAGVLTLLRTSRLLQALLLTTLAANLVLAGTFEVALPTLAHARFGATGYGALIACFGAGALTGTLVAARSQALRRPAIVACLTLLAASLAVSLVPFSGGLPGAAAAVLIFGAGAGFGNVVMITLVQQWAPPQQLGRIMSLVMLASMGSFPVSVAVAGLLVTQLGAAPFFPFSAAFLAVALLAALTQREVREFGAGAGQAAVVSAR